MDHIMHNKYVYQQKLWLYMQYIHVNLNVCVCLRGGGANLFYKAEEPIAVKSYIDKTTHVPQLLVRSGEIKGAKSPKIR